MDSATQAPVKEEASSLAIACVDGQDAQYIRPIREYLESNGCRVISGSSGEKSVVYHIVAGDSDYVKSIFAHAEKTEIRKLGIIIGLVGGYDKNDFNPSIKIVLTDPIQLSSTDVVDIFTFFFAQNAQTYDKRRNLHEPSGVAAAQSMIIDQTSEPAPIPNPIIRKIYNAQDENVLTDQDEKRIGEMMIGVFGAQQKIRKSSDHHRQQKSRRFAVVFFLLFIGIIIFPFFWYAMSMSFAAGSFAYSIWKLKSDDSTTASHMSDFGNYWLHQGQFVLTGLSTPLEILGLTDVVRGQERLGSFFHDVSNSLTESVTVVGLGKKVASSLLVADGNQSNDSTIIPMNELHMSLTSVQNNLGLAQAQLKTLLTDNTFPFMFDRILNLGNTSVKQLESARDELSYVDHFISLYPLVSGFRGPKTYLVLLQNSNELRPTGGFIGSVGILKFIDGKMTDFTIQDVYVADGQLKGHVDPPKPIRELLSQEHWYLRDSNWDPDFKTSAARAAWFYQKEMGTVVDGVIAINVPFVVDLLRVTGPITLSDYNDRITADNFFGKSIYYTMNNSFSGSTQKSDFLGTLLRALLTKITSTKDVSALGLFHAFSLALIQHDIMFMFNDVTIQNLVEHFGWAGRVPIVDGCEGVAEGTCIYDPFALVEANVSVSKVNYFISRTAKRDITVSPDGSITESYSLALKNAASTTPGKDGLGVGGVYRTYTRVLVPQDSSFSLVTLDGSPIPTRDPKGTTLPLVPYKEKSDGGADRFVLGIVVDVPPGTDRTLTISYKRGKSLVFGPDGAVLDLLLEKQPGVDNTLLDTVVHYPIFWRATTETHQTSAFAFSAFSDTPALTQTFLAKEGQLEYNTTILHDQMTRIRFTK